MVEGTPLADFETVYSKYKVFIMDLDGTLMNGSATIPGAAQSILRLVQDETKKVLFFTNGGYCNVKYNYDGTMRWLEKDLSAEDFAKIKPHLTIDLFYNTALLTGKYLKAKLGHIEDAKVMVVGNSGLLEEIQKQGLEAEMLEVTFEGEEKPGASITDEHIRNYVIDP